MQDLISKLCIWTMKFTNLTGHLCSNISIYFPIKASVSPLFIHINWCGPVVNLCRGRMRFWWGDSCGLVKYMALRPCVKGSQWSNTPKGKHSIETSDPNVFKFCWWVLIFRCSSFTWHVFLEGCSRNVVYVFLLVFLRQVQISLA